MDLSEDDYLDILQNNGGFYPADKWIQFAKAHNFQKTDSVKLYRCPDCNNEVLAELGQYIYYSNIIHIKYCYSCGLYFSDTLLNNTTVRNHFENSYNDELYFSEQRKKIFDHIAKITDMYTPENGRVLDVGGGKGHLLNKVRKLRPDIIPDLNDLSECSCKFCTETYGIQSFCGDMTDLLKVNARYNSILLIDVIYYESKLNKMFETIDKLLSSGQGIIIIRIPNKIFLIRIYQLIFNLLGSSNDKFFQSHIKHFNPEHIYIFTQLYLRKKLQETGFKNIIFSPSPMLTKGHGEEGVISRIFFRIANIISKLTLGKLILTPSVIVIANKSSGRHL